MKQLFLKILFISSFLSLATPFTTEVISLTVEQVSPTVLTVSSTDIQKNSVVKHAKNVEIKSQKKKSVNFVIKAMCGLVIFFAGLFLFIEIFSLLGLSGLCYHYILFGSSHKI